MENAVDGLTGDSAQARSAFNRLQEGSGRTDERDSLRQVSGEVNIRLADARRDLTAARRAVTRADAERTATSRSAPDSATSGSVPDDRNEAKTQSTERGTEQADAGDSSTDEPFPLWPVLGGIAAVAIVGGGGWLAYKKLKPKQPTRLVPHLGSTGTLPGQSVPRHEFDRLNQQVQTLAAEVRELREAARRDQERRLAAAMPAPAPTQPAPAAPTLAPTDAAASAFADWCRQGTPMMSRVDFFAGMLGTRVPGASARAVYRDLNSQAEPIRFDDRGGASPAEFWLVSVGGEALLFPQPLNAGQFRELTRVFEGTAAPKTLGQVVPARVRDEGGTFALAAPGRVS